MTGPEFTTMLLTTTGRKSGKQRTIPVYYVPDGKKLVAVCENFGLKTASSWPKNLLADPRARIEIRGVAADYESRLATDQEVARYMPRLTEMWPAMDTYFERTGVRLHVRLRTRHRGFDASVRDRHRMRSMRR